MTSYIRTNIINFYELPIDVQDTFLADDNYQQLEQDRYVKCPIRENEFLPLSNFLSFHAFSNNPKMTFFFDGYYGQTYFSAYFIKIGRDGETCVIAYRTT